MKKGSPGGDAGGASAPRQADLFDAPAPAVEPAGPRPVPALIPVSAPVPLPVPAPIPEPYPWRVRPPGSPEVEERPRRQILTVGELTRQIKDTIERGFARVCVRGEVTGFRGPNPRGHLYFSLKDEAACIDARIWASAAQRMKFKLRDGLSVIVEGSVDLYEPQGRYSLIVQRIEPAGEGARALAFQQLKEQLQAEGLFGDRRVRPQRPVPFLPRRIGVVTSVAGAALQDFLRVLHQRHPRLPVLVCDARVQGEGAALEVVSALERLSRTDVDVIVVTRGGGSVEDLWTFNEEAVARAIFACSKPVVSAIGHEVDFTIADFVADLRAPTPSAAAERLAPVLRDLELWLATSRARLHKAAERAVLERRQGLHRLHARVVDPRRLLAQKRLYLAGCGDRLERALRGRLGSWRDRLNTQKEQLGRLRPQAQLSEKRDRLLRLKARLAAAVGELLRQRRQQLARERIAFERASPRQTLERLRVELLLRRSRLVELSTQRLSSCRLTFNQEVARLQAMSPLAVMARGYSVAFRRSDGRLVRRAADVQPGDQVTIRLAGSNCRTLGDCEEVDATVTGVHGPGRRS